MKNISLVSLGCDKNRIDSENLLARLSKSDFRFSEAEEADVIIVNTCAFIDSAKEEAIDEILAALEQKKARGAHIIVTGCLPERYREELANEFPEVDAFLGIHDYAAIADVVSEVCGDNRVMRFSAQSEPTTARILTTPPHYAYLRIADGCNNHCTFCAIPAIRGKYRSRTVSSLVEEAQLLWTNYGVRELILVAQDTTRYGTDFGDDTTLVTLLKALEKTEIEKIRILYVYPEAVTDELLDYIASSKKVLKYADVPLQHVSDEVLRRMARRSREKDIRALLERLHGLGFVVRSTFMTGFPGETQEDFERLLHFIEQGNVDYAGFFEYCAEDGTPAAKLEQIAEEVKHERWLALSEAQTRVIERANKARIGRTYEVVHEDVDYDRGCFVGRTDFQAPDVDPRVYFISDFPVNAGESYKVKITQTDGVDLVGKTLQNID